MRITKYGHACLLVEESAAKILIDPGTFNATPHVEGLDAILITHEHADHCDIPQLKEILSRNPGAEVITHVGVGKVLTEAGITFTAISHGEEYVVNGLTVRSYGEEHAVIYESVPCQNTGFMIGDRFFYPGDAFIVPSQPVEILAVPTGGPWMKLAEAINYVKAVAPKTIIPVHDAMHIEPYRKGVVERFLTNSLEAEYRYMKEGSVEEF